MRLPALISGERRRVFYGLLLNGLAQGVLAAGFAWLIMRVFDRFDATCVEPAGETQRVEQRQVKGLIGGLPWDKAF